MGDFISDIVMPLVIGQGHDTICVKPFGSKWPRFQRSYITVQSFPFKDH